MNTTIKNTIEEIKTLDTMAGVYLYLLKGKPLYIGKSVNIKARLLSHAENARYDPREAKYIAAADHIECIQTDSELNALLLESQLIRTHMPRYNVRSRDDKSYLYIKVTIKDEFPKVFTVRRERDKKSAYFGPFSSKMVAEDIISSVRRIFPFCTQKKISRHPCFYSKIGLCDPCPNSHLTEVEKKRYRANIRQVIRTLQGKTTVVQKDLHAQMKRATAEERYEDALLIRNKIYAFERIFSNQLFGWRDRDDDSYNQSAQNVEELVVLLQPFFPTLVALPRIECYDISNLSQKEATASMVVFTDGQINKGQYRKFKIRAPKKLSDFDMLEETIQRRFKNKWEHPTLLVIDGGRPQIRRILHTVGELDIDIPVIGIAKNPDRLVIGVKDLPTIRPRMHNKGLNLLQHMRDESHRFAKKYHTELRRRKLFE